MQRSQLSEQVVKGELQRGQAGSFEVGARRERGEAAVEEL